MGAGLDAGEARARLVHNFDGSLGGGAIGASANFRLCSNGLHALFAQVVTKTQVFEIWRATQS